jgi:hypothetical protein
MTSEAPLAPDNLIEWRDMPPAGATCAVCGESILRLHPWYKTTRPPTRWVCGPCYAGMNGTGPDDAKVNSAIETPTFPVEATTSPEKPDYGYNQWRTDGPETAASPVENGNNQWETEPPETDPLPVETRDDLDDQVTPSEAPLARAPRLRSSIEPVPIGIGDLSIDIASVRGRWYVGIYQTGTMIAEVQFSTNPVHAKGAAGTIAEETKRAIPHVDRAMVRQATDRTLTALREAGDGAIVADAVARVINSTVKVEREMSDPPAYVIHLDTGDYLEFSNKELAALQPIALNAQWLAVRYESLRATGRDFETIAEHWLSMAVSVDPPGSKSPWEQIAEKLEERIAPIPLETDRRALKKYGIWLDPRPGGLVWIRSEIVGQVVTEAGESPNDPRFARYLERAGILIERSKKIRVPGGGVPPRAWGIDPAFKSGTDDDDPEGSLFDDPEVDQ